MCFIAAIHTHDDYNRDKERENAPRNVKTIVQRYRTSLF